MGRFLTVRCPCPDHEDKNPSAWFDSEKGRGGCWACGYRWTGEEGDANSPPEDWEPEASSVDTFSDLDLSSDGLDFLLARAIDPSALAMHFSTRDPVCAGRIGIFPPEPMGVHQERLLDGFTEDADGKTQRYDTKGSGLFWATHIPDPGSVVWLTEGPMDAAALCMAGAKAVVALLGATQLNEEKAFTLRDFHLALALDTDVAGYKAAKAASKMLNGLDISHSVVDIPRQYKDPGELWLHDPQLLRRLVREIHTEFDSDDTTYVETYYTLPTLRPIPSGFPKIDEALGGGFLPGSHLLQGATGVNKTTAMLQIARNAMDDGRSVLYLPTETHKRQIWARMFSAVLAPHGPSWVEIEQQPSLVEHNEVWAHIQNYAQLMTVLGEKASTERLIQVAKRDRPDLIIVDYLQRVKGNAGSDEKQQQARVSQSVVLLTDYAATYDCVILVVSSIARSHYQSGGSLGSAKYSGDAEFEAASVSSLTRTGTGSRSRWTWEIQKNRRGPLASQVMLGDAARGVLVPKWEDAA